MTTTVAATPDDAIDVSTSTAAAAPRRRRAVQLVGLAAAVVLTIVGVASMVKGLDGLSTVRDALAQERVVGSPHMTPAAIKDKAAEAGLDDVALPSCSVAGKPVVNGASARCFAQYMRVDALMGTRGATYAEMPRFASADAKGTDDPAAAQQGPNGKPVSNPARNVWVTETALATALNTSYMAEQISLFGIAVGSVTLVIGLGCGAFVIARRRESGSGSKFTSISGIGFSAWRPPDAVPPSDARRSRFIWTARPVLAGSAVCRSGSTRALAGSQPFGPRAIPPKHRIDVGAGPALPARGAIHLEHDRLSLPFPRNRAAGAPRDERPVR